MYNAIICKLTNVRKHPNADRLQLATVYGCQIIVGLENYEGELGIYFPTDGKLSEEYSKANNLIGYTDPETGERKGGLFTEKRRVKTQKLRGEISDGFWAPISTLQFTNYDLFKLKDGDQISELNGIILCEKYIAPSTKSVQGSGKPNKSKIKKHFAMFKEHADTLQLSYNIQKLKEGSLTFIHEKMEGTSGRTGYVKVTYDFPYWFYRIIRFLHIQNLFNKKEKWQYLTGTRRVVLDKFDDPAKQGFYGNNDFRKKWHDKFVNNLKKGETIYYEIVGYVDENRTIMPICDNKKLNDKEFLKQYGPTTTFSYGCKPGESKIFVYRITMTNSENFTVEYPWFAVEERCKELGLEPVRQLCKPFIYDGNKERLMELVESLYGGPSTFDPTHIKEGVVVRSEDGLYWKAFKHKNYYYKALSGIVKEQNIPDMEEAQDFINLEMQ